MKAIEIDSNNVILRTQDFPDTYTISNGRISDSSGKDVFPDTTNWYIAPVVIYTDGDIYDPLTSTVTPQTVNIVDYKTRHIESVRTLAREYIESVWPIWRQVNADAGIYPAEVKTTKDSDIVSVITESNRVEDLISDATSVDGVDAAFASINWPAIGV